MSESIWEREEFKPYAGAWAARQQALARREAYYDGSVYSGALNGLRWLRPRASAEIRPLYLPLARAVNVDAGIIPGEWTLDGRIKNREQMEAARDLVLNRSGWAEDGVLYVHYGSLYGLTGLRVSDLRDARKVMLSPVNPRSFMLLGGGMYDRTPLMAIICEQRTVVAGGEQVQGRDRATFEYSEVITPDRVRTFADGQPQGFDGRPAEYPNLLGLVPFVEVKHINTGAAVGDCAFEKVIPLLDQVNRLASELADVIHRYKDPQYIVNGGEATELVRGGENVWFLPEGAKVQILVADVDIPGVLEFIRESRSQVEAGLVQLAFDQVMGRRQAIAAETVKLQLMELVLYVRRTRPNYDVGLAKALRMAGRAAKSMLGPGFAGESRNVPPRADARTPSDDLGLVALLDSDDLAFDNERPVLPMAALGAGLGE
ncbi:MAG: phage portal protein [Rudaea sp.]